MTITHAIPFLFPLAHVPSLTTTLAQPEIRSTIAILALALMGVLVLRKRTWPRRRHVERALQESEERYSTLFRASNDAIFVHDLEGTILDVNERVIEQLGYTREELSRLRVHDLHPPAAHAATRRAFEAVSREGRVRFEIEFQRKNGEVFPAEVSSRLFEVAGVTLVQGAARDITKRQRAERELKFRSELERLITTVSARFINLPSDKLLDGIGQALGQIAAFTAMDRSYLLLFGEGNAEFSCVSEWARDGLPRLRDLFKRTSTEGMQAWVESMKRGEAQRIADAGDVPADDEHGRRLLAAGLASLLEVPIVRGGALIGVMGLGSETGGKPWPQRRVALIQIVAEIFGNALARRQMEDALRHSEENYRELVENINEVLYVLDKEGVITYVSPAVRALVGYMPAEITGRHFATLVHVDDLDRVKAAFNTVCAGGVSSSNYRVLAKCGETRWIHTSTRPRYDGDRVTGVQGILVDITARKQAESDREALEERLHQAQKMEAVGELAGGIAHDFNNLLTAIHGSAELLGLDSEPGSEQAGLVSRVLNASRQAAHLTGQLLAFARRGKLSTVPVDIHTTIEEVRDLMAHGVDRRIEIVMELEAEVRKIMGDPSQLQSALLNLGLNARDAMPEGGRLVFRTQNVDPSVVVAPDQLPEAPLYLDISVADTGIGMDHDLQQRIFEPFFTTKDQGHGTGLGLASVYGCVKSHNGTIRVTSKVGAGSTFRILLPLVDQSDETPPARRAGQFTPGTGHVVVVDDEEMVCGLTANALRRLGYTVSTFVDPEEAVAWYERRWRDAGIVILDLVMPKLSGAQVFRKMRATHPDAKVLLSSGFSRNETIDQLIREGAVGFLSKPFRLDELSQQIAWHLQS